MSILAHNRALHYLAHHQLTDDERHALEQVVHGHTGPCDIAAVLRGLEWLREQYRARGEPPPL
ncbi:MAG: hypothetical protein ACJ8F3_16785 [Xanthobacteraceae bacterium]